MMKGFRFWIVLASGFFVQLQAEVIDFKRWRDHIKSRNFDPYVSVKKADGTQEDLIEIAREYGGPEDLETIQKAQKKGNFAY